MIFLNTYNDCMLQKTRRYNINQDVIKSQFFLFSELHGDVIHLFKMIINRKVLENIVKYIHIVLQHMKNVLLLYCT